MPYQRKTLPSTDIGSPGDLPTEIENLSDADLADLTASLGPAANELGFGGQGFFPVAAPEPPPPPLPAEVPMYKVRRLLIRQGMMAAVQAYIDGLAGTDGDEARSDFQYAPNFVTDSPLALGAKAMLGLTDDQYRDLVFAAVEI